MDGAREYTKRWHHQQIVGAVGAQSRIMSHRLYYPVLETFLRAMPYTLRNTSRAENTAVPVRVVREAGGEWYAVRISNRWVLTDQYSHQPAATATVSDRSAWLMFTKKWDRQTKLARFPDSRCEGDRELGLMLLDMVSIMA